MTIYDDETKNDEDSTKDEQELKEKGFKEVDLNSWTNYEKLTVILYHWVPVYLQMI